MTVNTAKKGITAVVAIVLLLMMTVAAAGLAYMWISQMQTGAQAQGTEQLGKITQTTQTAYSIETVNYQSATSMSYIIRNTGTLPIDLITATNRVVYLNGRVITPTVTLAPNAVLQPKNVATVTITGLAAGTMAVGSTNTIKIVNDNGANVQATCTTVVATAGSACQGY
ncbi:MAG: archaellin/type IV pilin N-terminal domain-containing protein [Nanoarchaeota archaeon]|nr:hypothetical protein [Nanoarchaeota archaeon]MBU4451322.1 hypothetical protein [Nanoarchaeota archaeon]MCG2723283.1 hypothetical protein [archaeon]